MLKKLFCVLAMLMAHSAFAAVEANKADQAALESVKGIGPSMSTRILDARKKGAFKDWPDLVERVKGVGAGTAARYSKEGLTVNGAAMSPTNASSPSTQKKPALAGAKPDAKAGKPAREAKS